jgi:hypothetical protein
VLTYMSNNPLQESASTSLLARRFFNTAHSADLLLV